MSLQAYLLDWTIKRQVKAKLGTKLDIAKLRATLGKAAFPSPKRVTYDVATIAGVGGERVRATAGGTGLRLLYVHGGGFVACSARSHRPITGAFAARGLDVFAPNYRLAPEHRFPAGLDDVFAVWRSLAAEGPAAVAGDSAGGNLALALMLRVRDEGLPPPVAAALFSPATDMLGESPSHTSNAERDAMFNREALDGLVPAYLGEADPAMPLASPLRADLTGLPPMLIHAGEREILRDDSVLFAEKARAAGVTVELKIYPVVPHVWQMAHSILPEGRRSLDEAAAFLNAHSLRASVRAG